MERGLSSAVVRAFQEALGDNMLCMDADLQVSHNSSMAFIVNIECVLIYAAPA